MRILTTLGIIAICATASAQNPREDFAQNPYLAGNQSVAYPTPTSVLTPTPKGYTPVYMSHYGRHGSRFNIGNIYSGTYFMLKKAADLGKLTQLGLETMENVKLLRDEAAGRDGELTSIGAQQHREIAERMYHNFPEIFKAPNATIEAHATTVSRCILSMENAMIKLASLNPNLTITHDASTHDMYYMNQSDKHLDSLQQKQMYRQGRFSADKIHPERLMPLLFNDSKYVADSLRGGGFLMKQLFDLAMHTQNSEIRNKVNMTGLFTTDELYDLWQITNAYWYIHRANSSYTEGKMPFTQRNLLRKMIEESDSCLKLPYPSASLRYGHDGMVLPLNCLMELDNTNRQLTLEELAEKGWCDYDIIPMACNVQIIFYKHKDSKNPILVKVLRNENEAHLPISTDSWPYYKWDDVKSFYINKLNIYEKR